MKYESLILPESLDLNHSMFFARRRTTVVNLTVITADSNELKPNNYHSARTVVTLFKTQVPIKQQGAERVKVFSPLAKS